MLTLSSVALPKFSPSRDNPGQCTGRCSCARTRNLERPTPPPLVPALCALSRVGQPPQPSQCSAPSFDLLGYFGLEVGYNFFDKLPVIINVCPGANIPPDLLRKADFIAPSQHFRDRLRQSPLV